MKKNKLIGIILISIVIITATTIMLIPKEEKQIILSLSPQNENSMSNDTLNIDIYLKNQVPKLEKGAVTLKLTEKYLELKETKQNKGVNIKINKEKNELKLEIDKTKLNKKEKQKLASIKVKTKNSGLGKLELIKSTFTDEKEKKYKAKMKTGLYGVGAETNPSFRSKN